MYRQFLSQLGVRRTFCYTATVYKAPEVTARWFYATDVPESKPTWTDYTKELEPSKFVEFTKGDSVRLESSYGNFRKAGKPSYTSVSEDKLLQVNHDTLQLEPVYWEGPVYEVRRGIWFDSKGLPLSAQLTEKIEQLYLKLKPYEFEEDSEEFSASEIAEQSLARIKGELEKVRAKHQELYKVEDQPDMADLGNGKYVLYFNKSEAVIFPSTINNMFQLDIIRNFGNSGSNFPLLELELINRGLVQSESKSIENLPDEIASLYNSFISSTSDTDAVSAGTTGEQKSEPLEGRNSEDNERLQKSMEEDYNLSDETSDREIDHLVLCVHGIGQILGIKYESVNFVHSINVLRKTMAGVYSANEADKKDSDKKKTPNNKIQVLPISWRHGIDFTPYKRFQAKDASGHYSLPTLGEISVDGVKPLRKITGEVVLDVLLYYEPRYIHQIYEIVTAELNRVYAKFMEKNPNFKGKVHIMGHSLGSAIVFDIASFQRAVRPENPDLKKDLLFDIENLFCVGSPVGIFRLLRQTNIRPRSEVDTAYDFSDSFGSISSPKCENLYNLFHPCDPVGYRMEPLVDPTLGEYKADEVPFALKGFNTLVQDLQSLSSDVVEKFLKAADWFRTFLSEKPDKKSKDKTTLVQDENALGDIVSSLFSIESKSSTGNTGKSLQKQSLSPTLKKTLEELNKNGRVDYLLPMGVFDFSIIMALKAHVSYFEDEDAVGFIMREILKKKSE